MSTIKLRYVHTFRDRHGQVRRYFRRRGFAQVPLPGLPGSQEFLSAYSVALEAKRSQIGASRTIPGSLGALITRYYATTAFTSLAESTKRTYRNILENLRLEHGEKPVSLPKSEHVERMIEAKADTPAAANALLKRLRALMRLAKRERMIKEDPTRDVANVRSKSKGHATWPETEIARFEAYWPSGSRQRLAFALLLFTSQRKSDVIRLGRQHFVRGQLQARRIIQGESRKLEFYQKKTGEHVIIPIHPMLKAELDYLPTDQLTFLLTEAGKPFTSAGFGGWFHDIVLKAKVPPGYTAHGLRKAAARRLAEQGCTTKEIMAVGGWRTEKEVRRYVEAADKERLAESAMRRMTRRSKAKS